MATILIVDDDKSIRALIGMVLKNRGHHLIEAGSGSEAIDLFRSRCPAVTVLDLVLPDINGLTVLTEIKALDGTAQVIILTGVDSSRFERDAKYLGAAEILQKASTLHTIGDVVNRLLTQGNVTDHPPSHSRLNTAAIPHTERREYPRVPVQIFAVLSREGVMLGDSEITNLSPTGCALTTAVTLQRKDYLTLELTNPFNRPDHEAFVPFTCDLAVVLWVNPPQYGLEFIRVRPESKTRLHQYLHRNGYPGAIPNYEGPQGVPA